jgi:hypothetical protein
MSQADALATRNDFHDAAARSLAHTTNLNLRGQLIPLFGKRAKGTASSSTRRKSSWSAARQQVLLAYSVRDHGRMTATRSACLPESQQQTMNASMPGCSGDGAAQDLPDRLIGPPSAPPGVSTARRQAEKLVTGYSRHAARPAGRDGRDLSQLPR